MDGIANVARQQQSQVGSSENQGRVQEQSQQVHHTAQTRTKQDDLINETQKNSPDIKLKFDSKEKVEDLVKKLNNVFSPISTDIKFGVDQQDTFYVSVIEAKSNRIISRYPAEKAEGFLPKIQEMSGILFDSKG